MTTFAAKRSSAPYRKAGQRAVASMIRNNCFLTRFNFTDGVVARPFRYARLIALRLLRCLVRYFFLEAYPFSRITYNKLSRNNLFLCCRHILCFTCWHLRSAKFSHNHNSFNYLYYREEKQLCQPLPLKLTKLYPSSAYNAPFSVSHA